MIAFRRAKNKQIFFVLVPWTIVVLDSMRPRSAGKIEKGRPVGMNEIRRMMGCSNVSQGCDPKLPVGM